MRHRRRQDKAGDKQCCTQAPSCCRWQGCNRLHHPRLPTHVQLVQGEGAAVGVGGAPVGRAPAVEVDAGHHLHHLVGIGVGHPAMQMAGAGTGGGQGVWRAGQAEGVMLTWCAQQYANGASYDIQVAATGEPLRPCPPSPPAHQLHRAAAVCRGAHTQNV